MPQSHHYLCSLRGAFKTAELLVGFSFCFLCTWPQNLHTLFVDENGQLFAEFTLLINFTIFTLNNVAFFMNLFGHPYLIWVGFY